MESFGDLLLYEKQKKPIICLNNEINEEVLVAVYSFRLCDSIIKSQLLAFKLQNIYAVNSCFTYDNQIIL